MYILQSDRLRVDISEPGVAPNTTTRFDRAGFVEEVVLDGVHRFCASEPNNLPHRSSGGRGICNEYKTSVYEETPVGGYFMKPGIGLLLKETDEPYQFMKPYKARPFKIDVSHVANTIRFVTHPELCGGYALRQEKRIEVVGNRLEMRIKLENAGEKEFIGEEYNHNFITVNCMSLGPNYTVEFPSGKDRGEELVQGGLYAAGNKFTFMDPSKKHCMFIMDAADFSNKPGDVFEWIFANKAEGAQIHVYDQINLSKCYIWASDHMLSTESFHAISIAPGESCSWARTWVFENI